MLQVILKTLLKRLNGQKKICNNFFYWFDGGIVRKISDINLHINSKNYGIIEANHQSLINIISQYLKMRAISKNKINKIKF